MNQLTDQSHLAVMPDWLLLSLPHSVGIFFTFAFGCCVGSFINVLVHRLPRGMSIVHPPSRCPICGVRLGWRENLPVVGWLLLGGRCKACLVNIPKRYPLVEAFTGGVLALLYMVLYCIPGDDTLGRIGGGFWFAHGFATGFPSFFVLAFMLSMLIAATLIDAETFTIPLSLTVVATIVAFVGWGLQGLWRGGHAAGDWPIGLLGWQGVGGAIGGVVGTIISNGLLRAGVLKSSFADYGLFLKDGEPLADYPHARREMGTEFKFLLAPAAGIILGAWLGSMETGAAPPLPLSSIASSMCGYLVGAGLVWAIRMGGTLAFGREAMGLGDVHLMGAVGAALGATWVSVAFFLAPFIALTWVAGAGMLRRKGREGGELPYGPHLAAAAALCIFARPVILDLGRTLFPALVEPPKLPTDLGFVFHKVWWGLAFIST